MVAGVADGVEHSTWSKRGAKHASAAFIESVAIAVHANVPFDDSLWAHLQREVAREFHQNLMQRLRQDEERIVREGQVAPAWSVQPYRDRFFSPEGAKHRRAWFQSTLLATALGPHGGFALLLGDGLIRVDRLRRGHWDAPTLAKLSAEVVSSFYLTEEQVECSLVPIRAKDAEKIAVLMATHGVEKSSKQALDGKDWPQLGIKSASDCETYLLDLADRPKDQVEWGNMSLAFVERDVE
ncbi:MAG: protein phosphatase 2C domain-containing protein [Myxococcales bacterium]